MTALTLPSGFSAVLAFRDMRLGFHLGSGGGASGHQNREPRQARIIDVQAERAPASPRLAPETPMLAHARELRPVTRPQLAAEPEPPSAALYAPAADRAAAALLRTPGDRGRLLDLHA